MKNARSMMDGDPMETLKVEVAESGKQLRGSLDKSIVNTQVQIAKIIMKDAYQIQMAHPEQNFSDIVDDLAQNWKDNIKSFVHALMYTEQR